MTPAARALRLRIVDRLNEALMTLDLIDFADANVAEITLSEVDLIRDAIAAAADFIHEQNEREIEGRRAGGSP